MSSAELVSQASRTGSGTLQLLGNELATQFGRWRTWAMLGALALIPILLAPELLRLRAVMRPAAGPASTARS